MDILDCLIANPLFKEENPVKYKYKCHYTYKEPTIILFAHVSTFKQMGHAFSLQIGLIHAEITQRQIIHVDVRVVSKKSRNKTPLTAFTTSGNPRIFGPRRRKSIPCWRQGRGYVGQAIGLSSPENKCFHERKSL